MTNQKRITLKNVKHAEFASEETHCYSASLYFDGKRIGTVSNQGHGGCDDERREDKPRWLEMLDYVKTLPKNNWALQGTPLEIEQCLEGVCCDLVNHFLARRDFKREASKNAVVIMGGKIMLIGYKNTAPNQKLFTEILSEDPKAEILNLLPEAEAIDRYQNHNRT